MIAILGERKHEKVTKTPRFQIHHGVDALDAFEQSMSVGDSGWVRKYQGALRDHGYYEGSIDGDYNAATQTALENCLKAACRVIQ